MSIVRAQLFQKVFVQRNAPVKILMQSFIRHDAGLNRVKACGVDAIDEVPDLGFMVDACIPMLL